MYTHTHTHTHTLECYLTMKENKILPCATTGIDLESIMLSEVVQRKTDTVSFSLYVKSKTLNKSTNKINGLKRYRKTYSFQKVEWWGYGQKGKGIKMYKHSYKLHKSLECRI